MIETFPKSPCRNPIPVKRVGVGHRTSKCLERDLCEFLSDPHREQPWPTAQSVSVCLVRLWIIRLVSSSWLSLVGSSEIDFGKKQTISRQVDAKRRNDLFLIGRAGYSQCL